jgi:DNA (cytosine-5)-methyltransferase 1
MVISLFSGIGAMDLAFEAAGFDIIAQVEIDDFCNDILEKRWPDVYRVRDVRACTGHVRTGECYPHTLPPAHGVIGGFPCQDISAAGKGAGIRAGTRSGLWFEMARLIGELRPRFVFLENVPAILTRDGTIVLGSLAEMGYDARWGLIRASDAGAMHRRDRWFCVAYACRAGLERRQGVARDNGAQQPPTERGGIVAHAESAGRETRSAYGMGAIERGVQEQTTFTHSGRGSTQSRLGGGANGAAAWMDRSYARLHVAGPGQPQHVWEPPRTTDRKEYRASRLKALGNAVVPQVVYPLAVAIWEAVTP